MRHSFLLAAVLLAASCASHLPPGERLGREFAGSEAVAYSTIAASGPEHVGRTVMVQATAKAVCGSKGCWMLAEEAGERVLVRWVTGCGGEFAFPTSILGREVIVEGALKPAQIDAAGAAHLAEDAVGDFTLHGVRYEIAATAVLVVE
ncbi:MAG: DUF4920 domain-containing protein [Planctomycetota bacterium]